MQLAAENREEYLYDRIHSNMVDKINEYLRLICGYTKSTILIQFNVPDPYGKIYYFLKKSIMYQKEYRNLSPRIIEKYPILELWYKLPDKLYGYTREEIHEQLYQLIICTIEFEKKIEYLRTYEGLKVRKNDRKYDAELNAIE